MEITLELIVFTVLAVFTAVSALLAVTTKRILRAATYLLFVLFGTAGIYFQLNYSFLGAAQIAPAELVFCFEKSGVLRDPDDETTLIREITAGSYAALKAEGVVSKGMIPKIENALKAVANGVRSVTIKHSDNLSNDTGTVIR